MSLSAQHYKKFEHQSPPGFSRRAEELRQIIKLKPVKILVENTGFNTSHISDSESQMDCNYLGEKFSLSYPDIKITNSRGNDFPEFQQLMILYYFATADGQKPTGKLVSFANLPGGRMYSQAFQGYTGQEIVKVFENNIEAFKIACLTENGTGVGLADAAFSFYVFPKITVQLVYWSGDEDFSPSCQFLFDENATNFLPIDACAIIGSNLTKKIIKRFKIDK